MDASKYKKYLSYLQRKLDLQVNAQGLINIASPTEKKNSGTPHHLDIIQCRGAFSISKRSCQNSIAVKKVDYSISGR